MSIPIAQLVVNAVIAASLYLLVAVGFSVRRSAAHFFDLSLAAQITFGAYAAYVAHVMLKLPVFVAGLTGVVACSLAAVTIDPCIFVRLRSRGSSEMIGMITSMGIYLVIVNCISLVFSDAPQLLTLGSIRPGHVVFNATVTTCQLVAVVCSCLCAILFGLFHKYSRFGLSLRAIADDEQLARARGVNAGRVSSGAATIAAAFMALAGMLGGANTAIVPTMGLGAFLPGVVVAVIGGPIGIGRLGAIALLLASLEQAAVWYIGAEWQDAVALALLFVWLLWQQRRMRSTSYRKAAR